MKLWKSLLISLLALLGQVQAQESIRLIAQSTGAGNPIFDALITEFEKANPGIKINKEYFAIGTAYPQVLRTQLQGGNAPDLFYVTPGSGGLVSVLPLAKAGFVADLSKRDWAKGAVPRSAQDLYYIGDQLLAVPLNVVPIAAVYNAALFKQLGFEVPKTMAQLLALCKSAREKGKSMLSLAGANPQNAGLLASAIATNYVLRLDPQFNVKREAGKITFSGSGNWRKTLQTILDMQKAGCFIPGVQGADLPQAAPAFANGDAVAFVIPTGAIGAVRGINKDIQLGTFALPSDSENLTSIAATLSDALAVYKNSKNLEAALKFTDYVARGGGSELYAKMTGNITLQQATTGKNFAPELSGVAPYFAKGGNKVLPLIHLDWKNPEIYAALGSGVQGLLTGQLKISDVLAKMDAAWDKK